MYQNSPKVMALQKALSLEIMHERYPHSSSARIYTGDSAHDVVRKGGICCADHTTSTTFFSLPAGDRSSSYQADMRALITAAEH